MKTIFVDFLKSIFGIKKYQLKISKLEFEVRSLSTQISLLQTDFTNESLQDALYTCFAQFEASNEGIVVADVEILRKFDGSSIPIVHTTRLEYISC